ncbi:kinase-like domain-containing protein [Armillaria borealis]|uniref:Kinase-like domain-containing protein n=1 Tax=Armillaria borealis TaxID=47425 RepID=A0AA39MIB7_9AGAR|nr:kinase-like domain-containing protein [Armillaria borealis]
MRNFLLFQESWRNITHFASEDPHRVVDFLQKVVEYLPYTLRYCPLTSAPQEIDSAVNHQYRARCTRSLFYLVKIHDILPSSLSCMNVVKEGNHAIFAGGFSDIWKGRTTNGGSSVCLKVLRIFVNNGVQNADTIISKFCREALVWRNVKHPNVLPFLGVNKEIFAPSFCLISPWMDNGDIMSFLRRHPRLDRLKSITDVARGMAYLHSLEPPIVHADIRGANILITSDFRCCLADFGLALAVEPPSSSSCNNSISGSLRWLAPEILHFHLFDPRYLAARDVYAFGCTIVEIFTGKPPYPHIRHDSAIIHEVLTKGNRPERPSMMPDELWKLVSQCFLASADRRPLSSDLLYNLEELVSFPSE